MTESSKKNPPPKFKAKAVIFPAEQPPPSTGRNELRFEINETSQGFHWVLKRGNHVITGHYGPNPKTRAGAVQAIADFKAEIIDTFLETN